MWPFESSAECEKYRYLAFPRVDLKQALLCQPISEVGFSPWQEHWPIVFHSSPTVNFFGRALILFVNSSALLAIQFIVNFRYPLRRFCAYLWKFERVSSCMKLQLEISHVTVFRHGDLSTANVSGRFLYITKKVTRIQRVIQLVAQSEYGRVT